MQSERKEPDRGVAPRLLFLVGATILVFYAALLVVQAGTLLAGASLHNAGTLLAAALALGYFWLVGMRLYHLPVKSMLVGFAGLMVIAVVCGLVAAYYFDLSWDGRDYQQKAIRQLAGGWNPVYVEIQPSDMYDNAWLNHYPKGPWIAAASVVKVTGGIESGKIFNLLLIVAVFLISLSAFWSYTRLRFWQMLLLSLFLAANPVSTSQSLSYYVDGQVSSLLILMGLCLLLCLKSADFGHLAALAAVIMLGLNVKFTGTAYTLLLLAVIVLITVFAGQFGKLTYARKTIWMTVFFGLLLGLLVVGYQPYVTNTLHYGHPFYPIYGSRTFNKEFVIQGQAPPDFETLGWSEKLYRSIFSPSSSQMGVDSGPLKFPLRVSRPEVTAFARPDVRVSGWGPLFGATLVVALAGLALLLFVSRKFTLRTLALLGLVAGTTLLNSEAWWARYSPQLWLLPVIVLGALWLADDRRAARGWLKIIGAILSILMIANLVLVSGAYLAYNTLSSRRLHATLADLRQSSEEVMLYYGPLEAVGMRLQDYGIPYRWVERRDELACPRELEVQVFYSPLDCPPP